MKRTTNTAKLLSKLFARLLYEERGIQHAEEAILYALIVLAALPIVSSIAGILNGAFQMATEKVAGSIS